MLITFVLSGFTSLGVTFTNFFLEDQTETTEEKEKSDEIRSKLLPKRFRSNGRPLQGMLNHSGESQLVA